MTQKPSQRSTTKKLKLCWKCGPCSFSVFWLMSLEQYGLCDRRGDLLHAGGGCGCQDRLQQGGPSAPQQRNQHAQVRPAKPKPQSTTSESLKAGHYTGSLWAFNFPMVRKCLTGRKLLVDWCITQKKSTWNEQKWLKKFCVLCGVSLMCLPCCMFVSYCD